MGAAQRALRPPAGTRSPLTFLPRKCGQFGGDAGAARRAKRKPAAIRATGRSGRGAGASRQGKRYFALFTAVRRQRVQTSAFVVDPFLMIANGWRFG
jgi:hypothetical protein